MGSYRWPQGDTDKMSDASSSFDHVQPVHAASMASGNVFEGDAFDAEHVSSRYGIDPAAHCWAEITCGTPLFETMCKFLGHHADRSFAPNIENKELAVAEEMFGTDKTPKTVALSCGLGLTTLQHKTVGGDTVTVKVLRQRRGPIVATRCGPCAWESLIVFVEGGHSGKDTLQDFISKVVNVEAERTPEEYTIYRWHVEHGYWRCVATKKSRTIDSVVLPQATKDQIIGDLDSFLTRDMFDFYISHGIPYKRSYLFYGAPGAGKASLLTAIAGKYNRNLCILQPTDPRFTDDDLAEAIREAPAKSIIVLEDVDALFDKNREAKTTKMTISFSGLLNAWTASAILTGRFLCSPPIFENTWTPPLFATGEWICIWSFAMLPANRWKRSFCNSIQGRAQSLPLPSVRSCNTNSGNLDLTTSAWQHSSTSSSGICA